MSRPKRKGGKPTASVLTPKQLRLLTFIRDYSHARGVAPTMQELADEFGVSKVTVFEHIAALQKKGYLRRSRHRARSLRLHEEIEFPDERPTVLPLVGTIAAGRPIEAVEQKEFLNLEEIFVSSAPVFALRVKGDSMIGDNICDGDFVICEKRDSARDGDTVVALVDGEEATLKRMYRTPDGIRLEASNPNFKPIISKNVTVQGILRGVLRRY